jgi:type VI secretion system protein ImpI
MLTLTITVRDDPAREPLQVEVQKTKTVLGRAPTCDVVLDGRELGASGEHARIELLTGVYYVFDQGSTNGTYFNGTRIRAHTSVPLSNGDKIYIGRWIIACTVISPQTRRWRIGSEVDAVARGVIAELVAAAAGGEEALRAALRARADATPPHERQALLAQVEAGAPEGPVRAAVTSEIERFDAVRDACYQAMTSLSLAHTGREQPFERPEDVQRFFRLSDQALERMLEWIVGCISARRSFEDKFSAKVTRFFGLDTNPLKHALTPEQAGRYLLDWSEARDAEKIKTSLEQTLRDLTAHQLGVLAGSQHVVKSLLARLVPEGFEKEAGGAWLAVSAKAKAWDVFCAAYNDLKENETKLFNEIVYPALRQGYLETHEAHLSEPKTPGAANGGAAGATLNVPPPTPSA